MNNQIPFLNVAVTRCGVPHEITEVQLDGNGQVNAYAGKITTEAGEQNMLWLANGKAAAEGIMYDLVQKVPVQTRKEEDVKEVVEGNK